MDTVGFIQISAGSLDLPYVAVDGTIWETDRYFEAGTGYKRAFLKPTKGTKDDTLFHEERRQVDGTEPMVYEIPTGDGKFLVELLFSESGDSSLDGPGLRVFDVTVEDITILDDFDIYAAAGQRFKAVTESFVADVEDGFLSLGFDATADRAKINAIGVYPLSPTATASPTASPTESITGAGQPEPKCSRGILRCFLCRSAGLFCLPP